MNDFQDTPLTPEQLLASSNEALLQAATAGGNLTPEQLALVKASQAEKYLEDSGAMDYLVAGDTYKTPQQAHKLEVTPKSLEAYQKAGIDAASIQANINMLRMQGVSEEEISQRYWKKAKELDPTLLTVEEDEALAQQEYAELVNVIEKDLNREMLYFPKGTSYRYMVNREKARVPQLQALNAYVAREKEAHERGMLGAMGVTFAEDATLGLVDHLYSNEEMEIQALQQQMHPISSAIGHVLGFTGVGPYTSMSKGMWNLSLKVAKKATESMAPFWKAVASGAIRSTGVAASQTVTETNRAIAKSTEAEQALDAVYSLPNKFVENYVYALGGEVVGGAMHAMAYPVTSAISTQRTTNELFALQGRKDILTQLKKEAGADKAALELIKGIEESDIKTIQKIISTNPKLADTIANNGARWAQLAQNAINKEATPLFKKLSIQLLNSARMPQRAKQIAEGKPLHLDTSEGGMLRLIGENVDETGAAYAQALKNGQANMGKINAKQKLMKLWNDPDDFEAPGLLNRVPREDVDKVFNNKITSATFPGYSKGSPEMAAAQERIEQKIVKLYEASGGKLTAEQLDDQIKNIKNIEHTKGQREYFNRITQQTGTDDIDDIVQIKNMIDDSIKTKEVAGGEASAWGKFRKGLNTEILDQADPVLAEIHNIDKVKDSLSAAYKNAKKLTPANLTELENFLVKDGIKLKPARIAATKMSLLDSYRQAAVVGDTKGAQAIQEIIQSPQMKKYMNPGEWRSMIDAVRPEIKATEYITAFSAAAASRSKRDLVAEFAKLGLDTALNRQAAAINEVMMVMGKAKYNAGVAKKLQEWLTNPEKNWTQFNKIVEQTQDFAERQMLSQIIGQATAITLTGE